MKITEFSRWVNENNIPTRFNYAKGWWDYILVINRFAEGLRTEDVRVIGSYMVETPPPCEFLPMPAVALTLPTVTFALRHDFGSWSLKHHRKEWTVSVQRPTPYTGPLFGLLHETEDLRRIGVDGLAPDYLFGPYRQDPSRFSCLLYNEWDVAMFMRIMIEGIAQWDSMTT